MKKWTRYSIYKVIKWQSKHNPPRISMVSLLETLMLELHSTNVGVFSQPLHFVVVFQYKIIGVQHL